MSAYPIPGVPGLFVSPVTVLAGVPESAARFVVGPDPNDPATFDATELAARYQEWLAQWTPVALRRANPNPEDRPHDDQR